MSVAWIAFLMFSTVASSVLMLYVAFHPNHDEAVRRMLHLEACYRSKADVQGEATLFKPASGASLAAMLRKFLLLVSRLVARDGKSDPATRSMLNRAGIYGPDAAGMFRASQILLACGLSALYLFVATAQQRVGSAQLMVTITFVLVGLLLPRYALLLKAARRQKEISRSLPDALDLLVVCVEAGLGLNAAIVRVGQEFSLRGPALAEELLLVNQEIRTGVARQEALRHLAERNNVEDLKSLIAMMIQTDKLGTNLADSLRVQSETMRSRRRQRAEETAAKTSVKLMFPLVIFILPTLFIVILGPGLIRTIRVLMPGLAK